MVGLSLWFGLLAYGMIMIILTVWLVRHHRRRAQQMENSESGPFFELTDSNPRSGKHEL